MPSKTDDIEFEIVRILDGGQLTLGELMTQLAWAGNPHRVSMVINGLVVDWAKARYVDCAPSHNHSDGCVVEAVAS